VRSLLQAHASPSTVVVKLTVESGFRRMQERPSVKKLLAYEKEVNKRFAKTA